MYLIYLYRHHECYSIHLNFFHPLHLLLHFQTHHHSSQTLHCLRHLLPLHFVLHLNLHLNFHCNHQRYHLHQNLLLYQLRRCHFYDKYIPRFHPPRLNILHNFDYLLYFQCHFYSLQNFLH